MMSNPITARMRTHVSRRAIRSLSSSQTHFGYETIDSTAKEGRVRHVFDKVADQYDVMNDFMSVGIHRWWKHYLVHDVAAVTSWANSVRSNSERTLDILDVAGGTGDVAFAMVEASGMVERAQSSGTDPVQVIVCDINEEMLRVGQERARDRFPAVLSSNDNDSRPALHFVPGNAEKLPFPDNSFDLYTIAFGLRNVTHTDNALTEARRVLKPGGRFLCLEFSPVLETSCVPTVVTSLLQPLYDLYSFHVIPTVGQIVANDRASYQYLVESIRQFHPPQELVRRMEMAGMQQCRYTPLTGGIVAIHEGWKIV